MCRAEVLVGELTQPLRMAALHNSASAEVRCNSSPQSSQKLPLRSLHTSQTKFGESTILVFGQLVFLFLYALCSCGFDILLLSHKVTRYSCCKKVNGETHIAFECECQCCLSHACTHVFGPHLPWRSPGFLKGHERGMLF